jgi:hypothetical protein
MSYFKATSLWLYCDKEIATEMEEKNEPWFAGLQMSVTAELETQSSPDQNENVASY